MCILNLQEPPPNVVYIQGNQRINTAFKNNKDELADIMDATIAKELYEEVCNKYDKFTWNNTNKLYITTIIINRIPITIEVDYLLNVFRIKNENDVIAEYETDLKFLINNIQQKITYISAVDVLNYLRGL